MFYSMTKIVSMCLSEHILFHDGVSKNNIFTVLSQQNCLFHDKMWNTMCWIKQKRNLLLMKSAYNCTDPATQTYEIHQDLLNRSSRS